jgi:hypothetical protein
LGNRGVAEGRHDVVSTHTGIREKPPQRHPEPLKPSIVNGRPNSVLMTVIGSRADGRSERTAYSLMLTPLSLCD